jgi:hypothetical protein
MKISIAAVAALFLAFPAAVMAQDTIRAGVMTTSVDADVEEEAYNIPRAARNNAQAESPFRGTERRMKKSDADDSGKGSEKASKEDSRRERRRLSKSSSKSAKSDGKGDSGKGSTKSSKEDD